MNEREELAAAIERLEAHLDHTHGVPPVATIAQAATDLGLVLKAAKEHLAAALDHANRVAWLKAHPEELRCRVCGHPEFGHETATREQWIAHQRDAYEESMDQGGSKHGADAWATKVTEERFGPCPPEAPKGGAINPGVERPGQLPITHPGGMPPGVGPVTPDTVDLTRGPGGPVVETLTRGATRE